MPVAQPSRRWRQQRGHDAAEKVRQGYAGQGPVKVLAKDHYQDGEGLAYEAGGYLERGGDAHYGPCIMGGG